MSSKEATALETPLAGAAVIEQPPQLATLAHSAIVRSKTNPRTHFDAAYIQELANSIKEHGILQPILVRPLPASRLQDTFEDRAPGQQLPTHEIVAGECRYRAVSLTGIESMPVLIRHLDDLQVLQVQLVENLKRRDLHPLEEAEGFERLMKDHGMTVADIAAKVDKSTAQIYVTLKLLELTPECRKELYAGKLTRSTALLVARAPAYLQVQIAKDIMEDGFDEEPMSYRQAVRHIHQKYMLQLANAVFDIKDADLVAKAGACGSCAKNTGCNKDMFGDVAGGDTCTDPKCFDAKKVAHYAKVAKAAEAKGQKVIQGKEAAALTPHQGAAPKGYKLLDEKDYINGTYTSVRKAIGKDNLPTPVLFIDPHTQQAMEVLPIDVANKLLAKAKTKAVDKKKNAEPTEGELQEKFEEAWKDKAVTQLHAAIMGGKTSGITVELARHIALYYAQALDHDGAERFAKLFDVPAAKVGGSDAVNEFVKSCPDAMVGPALLILIAQDDLSAWKAKEFPIASLLATDSGVDLAEIQADVKGEMKEAAAARKAEAAEKTGKAKPAAEPERQAKKKAVHAAFMAPLNCAPVLQAVVGDKPQPRTEIVSKLWAYIKKQKLQDPVDKKMVNCDAKLQAIFGKAQVTMFEMADLLKPHIGAGAAKAPGAAKGKKTTAADAKAGISKALQATEPAKEADAKPFYPNDRVRFKEGLKSHGGKSRKVAGRAGTIDSANDGSFSVRFGNKAHEVANATADELELIESPTFTDRQHVRISSDAGRLRQRVRKYAGWTGEVADTQPTVYPGRSGHQVRLAGKSTPEIFWPSELEAMTSGTPALAPQSAWPFPKKPA
jgi:ParB/RepB/Spo0J family partition protein